MNLVDSLGLDFVSSPDGIICLVVGLVLGVIATQLMQGKGLGLIGNIIAGVIGGVVSGYIFDLINVLDVGDYADPIIAGAIGAVIVLAVVSLVRR